MKSINILLLIVSMMCIVGIYGTPLQITNESLSNREFGLPMTSASPLMEAQSERIQRPKSVPINMDKEQKVLANLGNNTILTECVALLRKIFPVYAFKANSSEETASTNKTAFLEFLKEIFLPNAFTEDTTAIPLDSEDCEDTVEDCEDTVEDEDPEGLGPRLSATVLKILTF